MSKKNFYDVTLFLGTGDRSVTMVGRLALVNLFNLGYSRPLFIFVSSLQLMGNKMCRRLDSNRVFMVSKPTEPQLLPKGATISSNPYTYSKKIFEPDKMRKV